MDFLIVLGIAGSIYGFIEWRRHRQRKAWMAVAEELGLEYAKGGPDTDFTVSGTLDGVEINGRKWSYRAKQYTSVEAKMGPKVPSNFALSREGILQKAGKMLGAEDIVVGDEELDDAFIIRGVGSNEVMGLLKHPEVKETLLEGQRRHSELTLSEGTVRIYTTGFITNPDILASYFRTVAQVAKTVARAASGEDDTRDDRSQEVVLDSSSDEVVLDSGLDERETHRAERRDRAAERQDMT